MDIARTLNTLLEVAARNIGLAVAGLSNGADTTASLSEAKHAAAKALEITRRNPI